MYALKPLAFYALDEATEEGTWRARIERIVAAAGGELDAVRIVTRAELPQVLAGISGLYPPDQPPGDVPLTWMRPLFFTRIDLRDERPPIDDLLQRCPDGSRHALNALLGRFNLVRATHPRKRDADRDQVCWPTHDFGAMVGCPHACSYCGQGCDGHFISLGVNIEEYIEQVVEPAVREHPWQRCFRMIGWGSDLATFEPENGLFAAFTRKMAELDRYAYFHTAGDNVDWVAALPHRDRLIGVWSLTCPQVARVIEGGAGSAMGRIEAARKCAEFGIPIRYKFKPIIPVRGWREQYAPVVEAALTRSRPESLGFCVIGWMDWESLTGRIAPDLLDPAYAETARAAADEMAGVRTGPFPHEVRAEIYRWFIGQARRWNAKVPLYVSTESAQMWDELAEELGQDARAYVCGCSSVALPGGRLALSEGCPHSTYVDVKAAAAADSEN